MTEKTNLGPPSPTEAVKIKSKGLRGTLAQAFANNITGAIDHDDQTVIKHHGMYLQDDRDRREERERKKLERAYSYMLRLRIPGGDVTARQWLGIQDICDRNASGTIKITTRQTVQIHGLIKAKTKPTIQDFYALGLDSIAACGDVNRNVMAGAHPIASAFQAEVHAFADAISVHLLPKTRAFFEIWLDEEKLTQEEPEEDALYGATYLPRKFKIAIAVPPTNDTDVFAHDIGLIAVEEAGRFTGFNVAVGGGMGTTHGNPDTYARLGTVIGFVPKEKTLDACWQIVAVQRDFGNRSDRKFSRLKYTVDRMGVDAFKAELERRLGFALIPAKPYSLTIRPDPLDWQQDYQGKWFLTLFVENGRVMDVDGYPIKTALKCLAETNLCGFRFTANQNVMLTNVATNDKAKLDAILKEHGLDSRRFSPTRQEALACVALSTCPLALAEAQRYMPEFVGKIEDLLAKRGLEGAPLSIRMTGCPNGCARPHLAEIGLIGKSLGHYNLHLGGDALGLRLNTLTHENLDEAAILSVLDGLFAAYAAERQVEERFGDFLRRTGRVAA